MIFTAFLTDENIATIQPLYNQAIDGVKLNVFEKDISQINGLLAEDYLINTAESYKNERVDGESFGSTNVSFVQATKRGLV